MKIMITIQVVSRRQRQEAGLLLPTMFLEVWQIIRKSFYQRINCLLPLPPAYCLLPTLYKTW
ncbi:MAG: hypothetical protein WC868_04960 [Bacteroidales bacterium]